MATALIRVARVTAPFSNGPVIGQCRQCQAIIHEGETHVETPPKGMLCAGCALSLFQVALWHLPERQQVKILHTVEGELPNVEQYYNTLGSPDTP